MHSRGYLDRSLRRVLRDWAQDSVGRGQARREPWRGVVAWERHQSGHWHAHGVITSPWLDQVKDRPDYRRELQGRAWAITGVTRVFICVNAGAVAYCLKYALAETADERVGDLRWALL